MSDVVASASTGPVEGPLGGTVEVVRSEERLVTGTQRLATGRVRFGKRLVTEQRTVQVTVRREEFFLEEAGPAGAAEGDLADRGAPPTEVVLVLREEEPVVSVATRPVERVVVRVDRRTEAVDVAEVLRREEVAVEGLGAGPGVGTREDPRGHA